MSDHAHPESDELIPQLNDDTTAQEEAESETFEDADLSKHFLWFQAAPAWLVSMVVHVLSSCSRIGDDRRSDQNSECTFCELLRRRRSGG